MPAVSSSPATAALDHFEDLPADLFAGLASADAVAVSSLVEALSWVPDPRCARGVRHQVLVVLVIAACAVRSGARSYAAISEWAAHLGHHVLARLAPVGPSPAPSEPRSAGRLFRST